ncbi:hypothetical protein V8B97DRAFT_1871444, partial [Scleroderma yunnanense]
VSVDYGLSNCNTVEEKFALKNLYKDLLRSPQVDSMELHAACGKGKLLFCSSVSSGDSGDSGRTCMCYHVLIDLEQAGM